MPMLAWRQYQHSELIQKLELCENENSLPIRPGIRETINQPLISEDGPGVVAEQALQPGTIAGCDGDIGVQGQIDRIADLHGRRPPIV